MNLRKGKGVTHLDPWAYAGLSAKKKFDAGPLGFGLNSGHGSISV
jgi:hypothetical protein